MEELPRPEVSIEEKIHENEVRLLNERFPLLDPLMCSVLLKCPPELMQKLKADPNMWITPPARTYHLTENVSVSDPEPIQFNISPESTPPHSPRSILPNNG